MELFTQARRQGRTVVGVDDDDIDGHRILGRAASVLHDHPILGGAEIESALPESDLGEQVERVRVTPLPLSVDEMSKLWNAFQTQYRLSSAYHASVVLIDSSAPIRAALPVLTRGPGDSGIIAQPDLTPPFPTLAVVVVPDHRTSAHIGDTLTLTGHHLDGDSATPILRHRRLPDTVELPAIVPSSSTSLTVDLPDDPVNLLVGVWGLALRISRAGEPDRLTNELPFALAPRIDAITPDPAARVGGDVALTVTVAPEIRPGQATTMLLSDREIVAAEFLAPVAALDFQVVDAAVGDHFVRLRIDGVDSELIDRTTVPPTFDPAQRVTIT